MNNMIEMNLLSEPGLFIVSENESHWYSDPGAMKVKDFGGKVSVPTWPTVI